MSVEQRRLRSKRCGVQPGAPAAAASTALGPEGRAGGQVIEASFIEAAGGA